MSEPVYTTPESGVVLAEVDLPDDTQAEVTVVSHSADEDSFIIEEPPVIQKEEVVVEAVAEPVAEPATASILSTEDAGDEVRQDAVELPPRKVNATQSYATSSSVETGNPDTVAIPPADEEVISDRLSQVPNIDIVLGTGQNRWASVLKDSLSHLPMAGVYSQRLNASAEPVFQQHLDYGGKIFRGRAPTFNKKPGVRQVEGEQALIELVTHLGVGGLFRAPLWNSGFWVTFKPATDSELLELNRMIYADKIELGRWSYGLALSNSVIYTLDRVFEFVLRHVYNTSVKPEEMPISELRNYIAPQDINSFIWGYLCANYPSGFHYTTACVTDPDKCATVIEENLNVTKLQWFDTSVLTEWQKAHMASMQANTKTLESIKRYREEMGALKSRRIVINQGTKHELAVTISTPTISEYINQGHKWIAGIVQSVNTALESDANIKDRNLAINYIGKATTLCQYVHWIEAIEYGELTGDGTNADDLSQNTITDQATIEETLKALSSTDSIREKIIEEVIKYINESTIAIIGVPAFDCPVCGKPQEGEVIYPRHTSVIPLDVLQVFFALLSQRLDRIQLR